MQNSTLSDYKVFPSTEDEFRAVKIEVFTEVEPDGFISVGSTLSLGDGSQIARLSLFTAGRTKEAREREILMQEIDAMRADFEVAETFLTGWMKETKAALDEAEAFLKAAE